jgi:hypothetical protein
MASSKSVMALFQSPFWPHAAAAQERRGVLRVEFDRRVEVRDRLVVLLLRGRLPAAFQELGGGRRFGLCEGIRGEHRPEEGDRNETAGGHRRFSERDCHGV